MLRPGGAQHVEIGPFAGGDGGFHVGQEGPHFAGAARHAATQRIVVPGAEAEQAGVLAAQPAEFDQRGEVGLAAAGVEGAPHALARRRRRGALQHRPGGRIVEAEQVAALAVARRLLPYRLGHALQFVGSEGDAAAVLAQAAPEGLRLTADLGIEAARPLARRRREGHAGILELLQLAAPVGAVDVVGRPHPRQHGMDAFVLPEGGVEGVDGEVAALGGVAHRLVWMDGDEQAERAHRVGRAQLHGVERGEDRRAGGGGRLPGQHRLALPEVGDQRGAGGIDLGGRRIGRERIRPAVRRRPHGNAVRAVRRHAGGGGTSGCRQHAGGEQQRQQHGPSGAPIAAFRRRSARRMRCGIGTQAAQNHASSMVRQVSSRRSTGASQAATRGSS